MMHKSRVLITATALLLGAASVATAQGQGCSYEGENYQEGTTVCQGGLQQTCQNGTWQSLDGTRCGAGDDQEVEAVGNVEVLPQGGFGED